MTTETETQTLATVQQIITVFAALAKTRTGYITLTAQNAEGYSHIVMTGMKKPAENLTLKYHVYRDRSYTQVHEKHDTAAYEELTKDLLTRAQESRNSTDLIEVELRFNHIAPSLAPAARLHWGIGDGRIELGRPF